MAWTRLKTASILAAVVLLGTIAFLLTTTPRRPSGGLLDGTTVVLEKVSYGRVHRPPQPLFQHLLSHLPASWVGRIKWARGSKPLSYLADRDIFTFWLKFSGPAAGAESISYAIAEEQGVEAAMIFAGFCGSYQPTRSGTNHMGLARGAGIFPRRCKSFLLRLYQEDGRGNLIRVAEFPIRNLGFREKPTWKPQPLPIHQQTNGLVMTLVRAQVGTPCPGPLLPPYNVQRGMWSEFRFRLTEQDQSATGWSIKEMWISDAINKPVRVSGQDTGSFNGQFSRTDGDEIVCVHRWDFWVGEPAWKLRVHFEHPDKPGCWAEYLVRPEFLTLVGEPRSSL